MMMCDNAIGHGSGRHVLRKWASNEGILLLRTTSIIWSEGILLETLTDETWHPFMCSFFTVCREHT